MTISKIKMPDGIVHNIGVDWNNINDKPNIQTKIDSSHKLSSDLVDDTDQTNKFVTDTDKTNWNNKLSSANGAVKSSNIDNGAVTLQKLESGVIDSTLSVQGAAAEAKATGAEINDLKTALTDGYIVSSNLFNPNTITADKRIAADGSLYDQSGDYLSDYISVSEGQILCFCKKWGDMISRAVARSVCAFDSSKTVITSSAVTTLSYSYTVPSGVSFVRIGIVSGTNQSITVTPADVMVFLSDTDSPLSYTFEEWFEPGLKPKASLADNANGGVDISLFGSEKTLAKQSDMAAKLDASAGAVKTSNINNGAVTTAKIASGAVTLQKLDSGVIDSTLSVQGAAAEAKATGDEIDGLKTALTDGYIVSSNLFNPNTITADKRITADGSLYDQSGDYLSDYIPVLEGQILCFCKKWGDMISRAVARSVCAFDSSKTAIAASASTSTSYSYTVPSGVSFVRIGIISGSNQSITVTPADVMVFLSDTDSPSSYTFEEWFEPGLKPKASLADNANGGVDISLFGSEKTLAKQSDMAAVETSVNAAQKVSVVRYSRGDNLYYCYETYENSGSIYIALLGSGGLQSENPFLSIPFSTLKTALSSYVDTSPDGIECIRLDHRRALLYDYESKTFSIADVRGRTGGSKLIIAQCANGMLSDGVMHNIIVKEKVDRNTKSLAYRSRSDSDVYSFAKRVQQDQTDKTLTILFMTDTHLDSSSHPYWDNYIDFVEKFGSVPQHCGVGLAIHGGDILTTGYTDKTVPLETLNRFCAAMRSNTGNVPMFIIKGNHDDNSYGQKVGGVQQFNYAKTALIYPEQCGVCMFSAAHNERSLVFDPENPNGGYCYYDDEISKIRVIMLNTNDNPSTMTGDNYNWNSTKSGFQERQLEWLSDVLKFEDRQDAAEWAVYIVSHIPIEISHNKDGDNHGTWFGMGGSLINGNIFFDILHAYENGTSGTSSSASGTNADWSAEVSYSFSRQGNFIGFLCGHMHADNTSNAVGSTTGTEYGYRYIGITAGLTFAAVTIDRENNSVSVRKYGGYNHITEDDNYYDSIIGLTDEDVNEYGDFTVEY